MSKRTFTNAKGQTADKSLTPPDLKQCQSFPNMLKWSFMTLGPRPKPIRCENKPVVVIVENEPGEGGLIGAMSLCVECRSKFRERYGQNHATEHVV